MTSIKIMKIKYGFIILCLMISSISHSSNQLNRDLCEAFIEKDAIKFNFLLRE